MKLIISLLDILLELRCSFIQEAFIEQLLWTKWFVGKKTGFPSIMFY